MLISTAIGKLFFRFIALGILVAAFFIQGCGSSSTTASTPTANNQFNVQESSDWTKESGVRIPGLVSTSTIRLSNGQYRMFYPAGGGIKSYISSDGLNFTAEEGTRVLEGSGSDYDAGEAKDPDIVVEDGYFRMYYTAVDSDNKHRVMSAISTDGYTFTKEAGVRIDYSASYDQLADVQSVVKMSDNDYRMYFVYDWYGDNSIKGATSTDGLSFEVSSLSGFENNCMDPEVVKANDGTLIIYFAAPRTTSRLEPMDIYKATSANGIDWTIVEQVIVPEKTEEGNSVGDPDVIELPDGTYRMYYYGRLGSQESYILSATAKDL